MWFKMVEDRPTNPRTNSELGGFFDNMLAYEQFKRWQEAEHKKQEDEKKKKEVKKQELPKMALIDVICLLIITSFLTGPMAVYWFTHYVKTYIEATQALFK